MAANDSHLPPVEGALRHSEELFRNAFEHTNVPMVLTDLAHRFVRANAAFANLFGYTPQEILNLSMVDITHPDDVASSFALRDPLLAGEASYFQMEKRYLHKDGHVLWGLANVSLVRDSQGRPYQYVGQVQDITERKRAEEAIAGYNERLRIMHQIDRALIAGEDPAASAGTVLPLLRDLLGVARVVINLFDLETGKVEWLAATGRRRVHVGPGIHYPISFMGDVEALRRGEHQLVDVHALPPGPEADALLASGVHTYAVVPMIARGDLIGALSFGGAARPFSPEQIGIAHEVATQFAIALTQARLHERVKGQAQELAVRNQTLTTLIDASPLAIIVADAQGRVKVWSHAAEQIFGWPAAEVLGQPEPNVPPEKQEELRALTAQERAGKATTALETYRLRRDGTPVDVILSSAPLHDAHGAIVGALRILGDISARKSLEEQFRQAQKMEAIGQLAGGVAHDFNNLLTVIGGYSDLLLSRLAPGDPTRGWIQEIHKAGQRAVLLTRQLLAFSRKAVVERKVLDLNAIVADSEKMLRRLIGEDVTVATSLDPALGRVHGDIGQVEQILMNLAVNARDAMPQGGKLTIETRNVELDESYAQSHADVRPGNYVLLAVTDTGCGMSDQTQRRVFEPFFTTKAPGQGTGLGLATVYGIVKQWGGHIGLYSELGRGTTFKVYLPPVDEDVSRPLHSPVVPAHGTETVLLVEDEDTVRGTTRLILELHGYTVLEATGGDEALRLCRQHEGPLDLLVTDVVMPEMGGRLVAERLRAARPGI